MRVLQNLLSIYFIETNCICVYGKQIIYDNSTSYSFNENSNEICNISVCTIILVAHDVTDFSLQSCFRCVLSMSRFVGVKLKVLLLEFKSCFCCPNICTDIWFREELYWAAVNPICRSTHLFIYLLHQYYFTSLNSVCVCVCVEVSVLFYPRGWYRYLNVCRFVTAQASVQFIPLLTLSIYFLNHLR